MAYEDCVAEIVTAGKGSIDKDEAEQLFRSVLDRTERYQHETGASRAEASVRAARELGVEERIAAALKRRDAAINALRRDALDAGLTRNDRVVADVRRRLEMIDEEARATSGGGQLTGGLWAELRETGLLKMVLSRSKAFERDIARELFRIDDPASAPATGNKFAEQAAKIVNKYQEIARTMQNEAGAHIGKLLHYITRQSHDLEKIRGKGNDAAYQTWRDFILPRLDERTFEGIEDRDKFLRGVWEALASGIHETSGGSEWLGGFQGPANLGKKVSTDRVLHFKGADAWLEYNDRFGRGNVLDSVIKGLEHAGRNTALMRQLGTNPEYMFNNWVKTLARDARARSDLKASDALLSKRTSNMLDIVTGRSELPENIKIANIGRWIRAVESMAKLGNVLLSSLNDIVNITATLRHQGVPLLESYANAVLNPLLGRRSGQQREIADYLAVGTDGLHSRMMSRISGEERGGTASQLVTLFHRMNFLSFWTDSHKTGVGLMLSYNLARNAGRDFAALPRRLQTSLRLYDIGPGEWDAMRQVEKRAADGRDYMMPGNVADLPDSAITHLATTGTPAELTRIRADLQAKLASYILGTTREAMNEATVADRLVTANYAAGTAMGEAMRLFMQFKQYPMSFVHRQLGREFTRDGIDVMGAAHLIVMTTLMGYASMVLKELAKGRNPRQPETAGDYYKLVAAAMVQGGGLGIYGDFLFGQANSTGGNALESFAGPFFGTAGDLTRLFYAIRDGGTHKTRLELAGAHGLQVLKNNLPFVNLFYTRLALDYFIINRLQEAMNPGYLRRYEQKVKKDNDQTFWLSPTSSPYH